MAHPYAGRAASRILAGRVAGRNGSWWGWVIGPGRGPRRDSYRLASAPARRSTIAAAPSS